MACSLSGCGKDTVKELRTMQTENYIKEQWTSARDEVLEQEREVIEFFNKCKENI